MTIHTAMVLAAGLGTRLKPLTDTTPKPLINVGGQPMILRVMQACKAAGIQRVVINTHYLARMIETTVRANTMGLTVMFSREDELLDTGGGIRKALPLLGDNPFLVINSDAVWDDARTPLLRPLMQTFNLAKHDALLAVVPTPSVVAFRPEGGDFGMHKTTHKLTFAADKAKAPWVYCGVHVCHPAFIGFEPEGRFSLVRPWQSAAKQGRLHGFAYHGPWVDMGSHTGLFHARALALHAKER